MLRSAHALQGSGMSAGVRYPGSNPRRGARCPPEHARSVAKSFPAFLRPHGVQSSRLLCPWDFPGKNTGVGCHFLLQLPSHQALNVPRKEAPRPGTPGRVWPGLSHWEQRAAILPAPPLGPGAEQPSSAPKTPCCHSAQSQPRALQWSLLSGPAPSPRALCNAAARGPAPLKPSPALGLLGTFLLWGFRWVAGPMASFTPTPQPSATCPHLLPSALPGPSA